MSRRRKILTASLIFVIGLALAWPFRISPPAEQDPSEFRSTNQAAPSLPTVPSAPDQVAARVASTSESPEVPSGAKLESFDLANHPALANTSDTPIAGPTAPIAETPVGESDSRPVYSTVEKAPDAPARWPQEIIHVVADGDTLEKLAERYLNDPGRALEIFDLNRDQLTNPHLLRIGVELRVPVEPGRIID